MSNVYQGMVVADKNGPIGIVHAVEEDATSGTTRVLVNRNDGEQQTLLPDTYIVEGNSLRINDTFERTSVPSITSAETLETTPSNYPAHPASEHASGEESVIPVLREEANIRKQVVERGGVRVHKRIKEREETIEQPVSRETVEVERIPIGQVVKTAPDVREEGDTLIIPVLEEILVVEKRLVLKEELRLTRKRPEEMEEVRVMLREEDVTIEELDQEGTSTRSGASSVPTTDA